MLRSGIAVWVLSLCFSQPALAQGLSPEEAVRRMKTAPGFEVQLVASEPQVLQPIFVKFDERGRLWTIQYLQYPNPAGLKRVKVDRWSRTIYDKIPEPPPRGPRGADKITVLIDKDHDGAADEVKDVITGLNLCTGLEFGHGGLFVLQVPYLLFYPDRNGDDIPDADPEVLLTGFGMEDAQSFANHLTWGPDGWLYGLNGSTTTCLIRGIEFQQGVWRYHPVTREFELFCEGGGNLYGMSFDAEGNLIYSGNGHYLAFHALQGAYYLKSFGKHGPLHNPYAYGYFTDLQKHGQLPGGPSTGGTIYLPPPQPAGQQAPHAFQPQYHHTLISGNFLGHSISYWRLSPLGATFSAKNEGLLVDSQDPWSCPTDLCLGPDGAIYWCDFYDQRTAHPDPDAQWDRTNGRIYRVAAQGMAKPSPVTLRDMSSAELVKQLEHPGWHASRARVLLAERRDRTITPALQGKVLVEKDPLRTLQYLWALHVSGGLTDDISRQLLDHPAPAVRRWAVRLIGDPQRVPAATGDRLIRLAAEEGDITVRSQLAATARRLPAVSLPVLENLLQRPPAEVDPYLSLMIWWGLESQALPQRQAIVDRFSRLENYSQPAFQFQLEKLVRRYAAEGTRAGYDACVVLLRDGQCPVGLNQRLETALRQGLAERAQELPEIGQGDFLAAFGVRPDAVKTAAPPVKPSAVEPVAGALLEIIRRRFRETSHSLEIDKAALLTGDADLKREFLQRVKQGDTASRRSLLSVLETLGGADCVPVVLPLLDSDLRLAALRILARFDQPGILSRVIALYPTLKGEELRAAQDLCLRRPVGTLALLTLVDDKRIAPADLPLDQLRLVALHGDPALDTLVRKHWGNLQPGTSEEKLATVRRFKNDLRAAAGNAAAGKLHFTKHCATCHKLFDEGGVVGPNLTPANRGDRDFLLVSIVDPNSVIRSQYLNYVITTQSGAVLQGVIAEQDAASVTLVDAKGQRHPVARAEIDEMKESTASLMPEKLLDGLSPQELRDLFAYLQGSPPQVAK